MNIIQLQDQREQRRTLSARRDHDGAMPSIPRMPQPIYTHNGVFARFCRWLAGLNARSF